MKTIKIVLLSLLLITWSCSSTSTDEDENKNQGVSIVGYWVLEGIVPIEVGSEQLLAEAQNLKKGIESINCNVISIEFNADKTLTLDLYGIEASGNDPNNPVFSCFKSESVTGTWIQNGNEITIKDSEGNTESITVRFDGNSIFYIPGSTFDDFEDLAKELIFQKLHEA